MSYDDDEIAESGDIHEYHGRTYSVVGDTVFVKGLFGWRIVENEDEEAEGGDHRRVNSTTYSVVGNTVYRKNWLRGWDVVDDNDERAGAGDISEKGGTMYSRVGNTVYKKYFFGRWEEVDDEEEAEGGNYRTINGQDYSIVGNSVYKKNFFGRWEEVVDDNERAEAGDIYERNGIEYSQVGDFVYKKSFFGGWEELIGTEWEKEIDEENDSKADDDYINADSSCSGSYDNNYYSDTNYSSDYNSSIQRSQFETVAKILIVIVTIIATWFICNRVENKKSNETPVYSNLTYNLIPVAKPQAKSANPFGEGNGRASFYHMCIYRGDVKVYFEDQYIGLLNDVPLSDPTCGGYATLSIDVPSGTRLFIFKDEYEQMWKEYVHVFEGECILTRVIQPEVVDKNNDGIYDHFTNESNQTTMTNEDTNTLHWIVCPQCKGRQEIEKDGYCTVCTHYGLGGVPYFGYVKCPVCNGNGVIDGNYCMTCKQTGQIICSNCSGKGTAPIMIRCNLCSGKGKIKN